MRILKYSDHNEETLTQVAEQYGVNKERLWEAYIGCMRSNYFDDLCDIARENEEELKRQTYELTLIMRAGCDYFAELAKIEEYIKGQEGKIESKELEGIKTLPYEILGERRAEYCFYEIDLPKDNYDKITQYLNVQHAVLRFLLIKQDERKTKTK